MKASRLSLALMTILVAGLALPAQAADLPKRKSGLWEIKTQMAGMPAGGPAQAPIQMCVDQTTDNMMQERSKEKVNCPTMDVNRGIGKVTMHMVCKHDGGVTSTTDAVITGDFDSNYKSDMTIRYDPPQNGMKEAKMSQEARWLGPCKPGQRPGDVIVQGMPKMNMQDMMNDPKIKEMMKRQQQGR